MKKFIRTIEDFVCDNCGHQVKGSGYTNHCPQCLFSKHVDNNPGDRQNSCHGLMAPVSIEQDHGQYVILHHCQKCGAEKKNKSQESDNFDLIVKIAQQV